MLEPLLLLRALLVEQESMSVTVSFALSGTALLSAAVALFKMGTHAGRFSEFKEQLEKRTENLSAEGVMLVRRHEIEALSAHLNARFDSLERQLHELRKV